MKKLQEINWGFLDYKFLGTEVSNYAIFISILLFGFLFKRYISVLLTRLFHRLYKKYTNEYSFLQFRRLLSIPIEKLTATILYYIAFLQIDQALANIILLKRKNILTDSGIVKQGNIITLQQAIDKIFFLLIIFYIILLITRFLDYLFLMLIYRAQEKKEKGKQQLIPLLKDVVKVIIWFFGFFTILGIIFKVNVGTLIAGLGIGGFAIAFAAKDSLENLIASFMVMVDKPFLIGDWISVENVEGRIEKIGFRSTRIRSFDQSLIIVPNKKLIEGKLENFSERGVRRVLMSVKIAHGLSQKDIHQLMRDLKTMVLKTKHITAEPMVYFDILEKDTITISLRYFVEVKPEVKFEYVKEEINFGIYNTLNRYTKDFSYIELNEDKNK